MSDVIARVQGAKLLLVPVAAGLVLILFLALPALGGDGRLMAWTLAYAILRGLNPLWYFQGVERVRSAVAVDAVARGCAALGVFYFVRSPADGWCVLALQATFAGLSLVILVWRMSREVTIAMPTLRASLSMLYRSSGIFGMRAASGLVIQANTLLLASLASATVVAFFGGAERIVRASINLLQPLTQSFLPRLSYLSVFDPAQGRRTIEQCLLAIGSLGALFGIVAFAGAPLLTRVLLGPGYEGAIPVIRALSVLPFLTAVNTVFGLFWAVPFGHERAMLVAVLIAGAVNILLAVSLVPRFGALGMAYAVVLAELSVSLMLSTLFHRRRGAPNGAPGLVTGP
jgi:PST family polysaccharide transporter